MPTSRSLSVRSCTALVGRSSGTYPEVFPAVDDLVKEGGEYEGYLPIFRGDNAGPHKEKTKGGFDTFCAEYCEERGWRWEPQSAQSPEFNNNDLTVFPAMSKRHSIVLKKSSGRKIADKDTTSRTPV